MKGKRDYIRTRVSGLALPRSLAYPSSDGILVGVKAVGWQNIRARKIPAVRLAGNVVEGAGGGRC